MAPIALIPKGKGDRCAISADGTLSFPQSVLDRLGWQPKMAITVAYIAQPLTLLLGRDPAQEGYSLSYQGRTQGGTTGGKLTLRAFANQHRHRILLPQAGLRPAYLAGHPYELGLLLEAPDWTTVDFSLAGLQQVPEPRTGVYQIVGSGTKVLRIGEGELRPRLSAHLKHEPLVRAGQQVRYLPLAKGDSGLLERVLLALHEAEHGQLPPFNAIRA